MKPVLLAIVAATASTLVASHVNADADGGVPQTAVAVEPSSPSAGEVPSIATPVPTEWMPAGAMRCVRRGRLRGFCAGPRRVPQPAGASMERAHALGLGTRAAASRLLSEAPRDEWVAAARGTSTEAGDASTLLWPLEGGTVWRHFGRVRHRRRVHQHEGVDLGAPEGTPIRAVNEGIVAYSDNEVTGYGNLVLVVHPDRSVTFYAHCRATYVMAGDHVLRGQVLGEVGDTGYARGAHLHFEWHVEGRARDPLHHFVNFPTQVHITPPDPNETEEVEPADELPHARATSRRGRDSVRAAPARGRTRPPAARPRRGARSRHEP